MSDDRWDENWQGEYPVILGQGSMHGLSDNFGRVFGKKGARICVRIKRNPIGFQIPARRK